VKLPRLKPNTAQRQLRAYVYIDEFRCAKIGNQAAGPKYAALKITPIWKNSGQTPTRNMKNHISWAVFENPFRDDIDFVDLDEFRMPDVHGSRTYPLAVPPGECVAAEDLLLWREYVEQMGFENGKITAWIYIWGWTECNDVFEDSPRRRTEFCVSVEIAANNLKTDKFEVSDVGFCAVGRRNRADEECAAKMQPEERSHGAPPRIR
jgi:hypothetical protein